MRSRRATAASALAALLVLAIAQTTAARPIYTEGSGTINQDSGVDLDFGYFNEGQNHPGTDDLVFDFQSKTQFYLGPTNNALIALVAGEPTYQECKNSATTIRHFNPMRRLGSWFCLRTGLGRYSRFHILNTTTRHHVDIAFRTWCKLVDNC